MKYMRMIVEGERPSHPPNQTATRSGGQNGRQTAIVDSDSWKPDNVSRFA
jgi:hypothetical protein